MLQKLAITLLLSSAVLAQDVETPKPDATTLQKALADLWALPQVGFSGQISTEEPLSGSAGMISFGPGGSTTPEFSGSVDLFRKGQELLLLSKSVLPAVAIYKLKRQVLTQVTCGRDKVGCDHASVDLASLFNPKRLGKAAAKARWKVKVDEEKGEISFRGQLKGRLIREADPAGDPGGMPGMDFMKPKVRRVEAKIVLTPNHQVKSLRFRVVRSDPMAALRKRMQDSNGEGGIEIGPGDLEMDEEDQEDGAVQTYELRVTKYQLSKRAKAVLGQMRAATQGK